MVNAGGRKKVKVAAEQIDQRLADLKLTHAAQIEWGTLYAVTSKDGQVMEFAWKDANVVLFISTVDDGQSTKETARKRPPLTQTGARITRKVFGDEVVKTLRIPTFIFYYNLYMGGVDIADQLRSYFNTQRTHRKTWKPLFHFLLDTVLGNSYLLSSYRPTDYRATRQEGHKQFRRDLRDALFDRSTRKQKRAFQHPSRRPINDIVWHPTELHILEKLWLKPKNCSACIQAQRSSQEHHKRLRKPLSKLSPNTVRKPRDSKDWKRPLRAPRTHFGCKICRIPFCRKDECWQIGRAHV